MKRTYRIGFVGLGLAALAFSGCLDKDPARPELQVIEEADFDPSLGVDLSRMTRTASGLYYEDLVVGEGAIARTGDLATVRYTGWLINGVQFDAGEFSFVISAGTVIDGFDEGVRGMAVGGKRKLVIPPGLAYGASGSGPIPPGAILVMDVELLDVS
ncbi:MAG: FKBP-type peptidyl-prolyl cis-trans isomerase [Gemmatimonadota bacterium]